MKAFILAIAKALIKIVNCMLFLIDCAMNKLLIYFLEWTWFMLTAMRYIDPRQYPFNISIELIYMVINLDKLITAHYVGIVVYWCWRLNAFVRLSLIFN